ncbi:MAG: ABC transporter ATP-binding protein [Trebonia sp.]|jgi:peptide/nickel transport system ATP-binding protein
MTAPLLEVRGLSVEYRRRRAVSVAVDDVSFAVSPGETVGVVGESGSGKTTIARAILGLTAIRSGEVLFGGRDVTGLDAAGRRRLYRQVQLVFQDPYSSLNPSRTVGRTLAEPLQAYGEKDAALVRTRVRGMLERVQLPEGTADRYPRELSGGQRQRVAIARALMLSPRLVILDEPLSALDLSAQAQILNLLRELQAGAGVSYLFISHDLEVVRYLCDRVVVMYRGRVMETGPAELVSGQPAHPYTRMLHQASPVPDPRSQRQRHATEAVLSLAESAQRHQASGKGCNFAARCPFAVNLCWTEPPARQSAQGGGEVACHQWPQWREKIALAGHARPVVRSAVPDTLVNVEAVPTDPGRANVVEGALRGEEK